MGASDSKLVFKQGIFRLSNELRIPATDPYWKSFWELPESAEDVFTLFSATDIRRARDQSLPNIETLITALTTRLFRLRDHTSFPDPDFAPEREALNCVRILTRILPFLYEANLDSWEDKFFWAVRKQQVRGPEDPEVLFDDGKAGEPHSLQQKDSTPQTKDIKPLGEELIDALVDLLFYSDFTLPRNRSSREKVTYTIWQSGVGCNTAVGSNKDLESNRTEILRLLLTLTSKSMYMPANSLPTQGVKAITYLVTCTDKQVVLSVLCSLLNTTMNFNPASWRVPYDHVILKDPQHVLVTYCLQLLLVVLLYPIPETFPANTKNYYRHFFGRLHRPQDFKFLIEGMTRILSQPMQANSSYLPGSRKSIKTAPEVIMLFWEALQCNKRFRAYLIDSERALEFVVPILFYTMEYRSDAAKLGVVRMCIFVIQTLSTESAFCRSLNQPFEGHDSLPAGIRIQGFNGTYADFIIISMYTLFTGSQGKLNTVYPALMAIWNNMAAYLEGMSAASSSKVLQLFSSMSSPSFLLANDTNHDLLQSLLEFMNAIIEHQYSSNPSFVYAILRSKKKFDALRTFTLESGQEEIERQRRRQKDRPADINLGGRANSTDSSRSPLNTLARTPTLSDVPENSDAFAIGDDEDSDEEIEPRPTPSARTSRAHSASSSVDDAVPLQLRGMSEKARGKMPVSTPTFSRQGSTTSLNSHGASVLSPGIGFAPSASWIESWLPNLPLHTILILLSELSPHLDAASTPSSVHDMLTKIPVRGIEPSPIRLHLFEWSTLSLGWYESLLWGLIFTAEMVVSAHGTVGVWNGTLIRLFRVQEVGREGPSLMQPRGMVDAVGSNLVNRVTSLNLRGATPESPTSTTGAQPPGSRGRIA